MSVKMLFFAQCADWTGCREKAVAVERPGSVLELLKRFPELKSILDHQKHLRVAVNLEFSDFNAEVKDGDEIAFMPPVSGG